MNASDGWEWDFDFSTFTIEGFDANVVRQCIINDVDGLEALEDVRGRPLGPHGAILIRLHDLFGGSPDMHSALFSQYQSLKEHRQDHAQDGVQDLVSELIQNALDAGASRMKVVHSENGIEFMHNGSSVDGDFCPFNFKELNGILRPNESSKRASITTEGRFGYGFKYWFFGFRRFIAQGIYGTGARRTLLEAGLRIAENGRGFHEENGVMLRCKALTEQERNDLYSDGGNWWTTRFAFTEPLSNNFDRPEQFGEKIRQSLALLCRRNNDRSIRIEAEHGDLKADLVELDEFEHEDMDVQRFMVEDEDQGLLISIPINRVHRLTQNEADSVENMAELLQPALHTEDEDDVREQLEHPDVEICFLLTPGQRVGVAGSMFIAPDSSLPFCGIVAAPWLFEPSRRNLSSNPQRKEWNNALLQTCYRAFDEVMAFLLETVDWGGLGWDLNSLNRLVNAPLIGELEAGLSPHSRGEHSPFGEPGDHINPHGSFADVWSIAVEEGHEAWLRDAAEGLFWHDSTLGSIPIVFGRSPRHQTSEPCVKHMPTAEGVPEGILRRAEEDPTAKWIGNFDHVEQDVHDRYRFRNETVEDVETIPAAPDAIMDEDHLFVRALVDLPNSGVEVVKPVSERENLGRRSERTGMERLPLLRRLAYHAHRRSTEEGGFERLQPVLEALHARVSNDDALAREICLTSDEGGHWTMLLMPQEGHRWGVFRATDQNLQVRLRVRDGKVASLKVDSPRDVRIGVFVFGQEGRAVLPLPSEQMREAGIWNQPGINFEIEENPYRHLGRFFDPEDSHLLTRAENTGWPSGTSFEVFQQALGQEAWSDLEDRFRPTFLDVVRLISPPQEDEYGVYNVEPRPHDYDRGPQPGFLGAQTGQSQHFEGGHPLAISAMRTRGGGLRKRGRMYVDQQFSGDTRVRNTPSLASHAVLRVLGSITVAEEEVFNRTKDDIVEFVQAVPLLHDLAEGNGDGPRALLDDAYDLYAVGGDRHPHILIEAHRLPNDRLDGALAHQARVDEEGRQRHARSVHFQDLREAGFITYQNAEFRYDNWKTNPGELFPEHAWMPASQDIMAWWVGEENPGWPAPYVAANDVDLRSMLSGSTNNGTWLRSGLDALVGLLAADETTTRALHWLEWACEQGLQSPTWLNVHRINVRNALSNAQADAYPRLRELAGGADAEQTVQNDLEARIQAIRTGGGAQDMLNAPVPRLVPDVVEQIYRKDWARRPVNQLNGNELLLIDTSPLIDGENVPLDMFNFDGTNAFLLTLPSQNDWQAVGEFIQEFQGMDGLDVNVVIAKDIFREMSEQEVDVPELTGVFGGLLRATRNADGYQLVWHEPAELGAYRGGLLPGVRFETINEVRRLHWCPAARDPQNEEEHLLLAKFIRYMLNEELPEGPVRDALLQTTPMVLLSADEHMDAHDEYRQSWGLEIDQTFVDEFERLSAGEREWDDVFQELLGAYGGRGRLGQLTGLSQAARQWYQEMPCLNVNGNASDEGMAYGVKITERMGNRWDVTKPPQFEGKVATVGNIIICNAEEHRQLMRYDEDKAKEVWKVMSFAEPTLQGVMIALREAVEQHFEEGDPEELYVECQNFMKRFDGVDDDDVTVRFHEHHALVILAWLTVLCGEEA